MWKIDKTFEFDYGHSVWNQVLDAEFSLCDKLVCRHEHGHRGVIKVAIESDILDSKGMVIDFKELDWFKKWVDDTLDHKMILDINDPGNYERFYFILSNVYKDSLNPSESAKDLLLNNDILKLKENHWVFNIEHIEDILDAYMYKHNKQNNWFKDRVLNRYEGIILVNFVPTSENLSSWFFEIVKQKLKSHPFISHKKARVSSIDFWETPKSHTFFKGDSCI